MESEHATPDAKILQLLLLAVREHGISAEIHGDAVVVQGGAIALRGRGLLNPHESGKANQATVEIEASVPGTPTPIIEVMSSVHADADRALNMAFAKFLVGALHVLLEAFVPHACQHEQAAVSRWKGKQAAWKVLVGPGISECTGEARFGSSLDAFVAKLRTLVETTVPEGVHALSFFVGGYDGRMLGSNAWLDSTPWDAGQRLLDQHPWPFGEAYESLRVFVLLLPEAGHATRAAAPASRSGSALARLAAQWSIVAMVAFGTMLVIAAKSAHSVSPLLALVLLAPLGFGIGAQKPRATRADIIFALVLNGSLFGYAVLDAIRSFNGGGGPLRTIVSLALLAAPAALHLVVLYPRAAVSSRS